VQDLINAVTQFVLRHLAHVPRQGGCLELLHQTLGQLFGVVFNQPNQTQSNHSSTPFYQLLDAIGGASDAAEAWQQQLRIS
jgi:hypothetical protein